jgi:peptide/nickel transport system ATP-binding protein
MMSDNGALLRVKDLKSYFRTSEGIARAVDGVSFDIGKGSTFALVGESGCGKSVTALSIMRLLAEPAGYIAGGSIHLGDTDLTSLPYDEMRDVRGNRISMIFQEPMTSLNPVFTVGYQIREAICSHQLVSRNQARAIAVEMLDKVGIPDPDKRYDEYPHQLSGGMRQRVMIAMALACRPSLLIADEPTTALDVTIQAQILNLMKELQQTMGTSILLITHDLGVVYQTADRVGVMYAGKIVELADRDELFSHPLHPYTAKLFQSLPGRQKRGEELHTIEGVVPKATEFPDGCRFADRCDCVMDICRTQEPRLCDAARDHVVACHLYKEDGDRPQLPAKQEASGKADSTPTEGRRAADLLNVSALKMHFPIKKGVFKRTVGHVKAVDGVDLVIPRGRTLALVGESGCGKTTVGKCILQLIRPSGGQVDYGAETTLTALRRSQLKPYRSKMQIIFQDPYSSLNPRMMIGEIIEEGMKAHGIGDSRKERELRIKDIMKRVGLAPEMMYRYPHEFSGGQRQRISVARALAVDPEFIVCDEPTSALDVSIQAQILNLLKKLQMEMSLTYLFITHDLAVVEYLADAVAVMYLGRIVERGTVVEVFDDPKHPYTRALFAAIPRIDEDSGLKKIFLEGDVPSPSNPPKGCHFHPRCPHATDRCKASYPGPSSFSSTHSASCFLYS